MTLWCWLPHAGFRPTVSLYKTGEGEGGGKQGSSSVCGIVS